MINLPILRAMKTDWMSPHEKYNSLKQGLKKLGKVIVAYSGGVDSTFLLKAAVDTLGAENVLACINTGPTEPAATCVCF